MAEGAAGAVGGRDRHMWLFMGSSSSHLAGLAPLTYSPPRSMACFAWNQGECSFQFCKFKHQCVRCGGGGGGGGGPPHHQLPVDGGPGKTAPTREGQ